MRYLYIDNIRGFTDTYIPIKDVNFLVGENSTGKTTILEIIKLLSDPMFWSNQNFGNIEGLRFRGYQSIVNINSQDKSYFRIGMIENYEEVEDKQSKQDSVFLLTFSNRDEMPVISEYCYLSRGYEIKIIIQESGIMYKFLPVVQMSNTNIYQIFEDWTNCKVGNSEGYKEIKNQSLHRYPFTFTTVLITEIVEREFLKKEQTNYESAIKEITDFPKFARNSLVWFAPIRSKPRRTYDEYNTSFSPEGDHIPYLLRQILSEKNEPLSSGFLKILNSFGKDSGLFDSIGIKEFGKELTSPFEVNIVINDKPIAISEVGYGVPQALPIAVEAIKIPGGSWYAIQQPEIHLHPRAQAALGELFYIVAVMEKKRFFIETHSDYIIDRFRMCYQKNEQKNIDSQVLFFEKTPTGNKVYPIEIEKTGEYSEDQPSTFREFFINEALALLGV